MLGVVLLTTFRVSFFEDLRGAYKSGALDLLVV